MNLQYIHDRMRSALWRAGGKSRKAGDTRDALWVLYTELDEHLAPDGEPCVSTANGKTHVWPSFVNYWRCSHFPSCIQNWADGVVSCWVCGANKEQV